MKKGREDEKRGEKIGGRRQVKVKMIKERKDFVGVKTIKHFLCPHYIIQGFEFLKLSSSSYLSCAKIWQRWKEVLRGKVC